MPGALGAPGALKAVGAGLAAMAAMKSASVAPQLEQTLAVAGLTVPHFGHLMIVGVLTLGSGGSAALQNGQATGRKLGDMIFLPHSGQTSGPEVTSGGLKHMTPSLSRLRPTMVLFTRLWKPSKACENPLKDCKTNRRQAVETVCLSPVTNSVSYLGKIPPNGPTTCYSVACALKTELQPSLPNARCQNGRMCAFP
jgi:hypothetical protein